MKLPKNSKGAVPVLLLLAVFALVSFLAVSNVADFKNKPFGFFFPKTPSKAAASFNLLGINPYAAAQPTATGKILATLQPFGNKIYIGYGDYGANTGPIQISSYDPTSNTFSPSMLSTQTEALYIYRQIGNNLYAPLIDPQGSLVNIAYAKGEPWSVPPTQGIDAAHIFDVATLTGSDLFAVGSAYSGSGVAASVWRSLDGGNTWTTSLHEEPVSAVANDFARYYFAGVYNNKLYVQAQDYYGGIHSNSRVFDGNSWTYGPSLFPTTVCYSYGGWKPQVFSGKMVYMSNQVLGRAYLIYFDGIKSSCLSTQTIYDFFVDGSYLYILATDGTIKRTTDLVNWQNFAVAPAGSRSIAVLNGTLYVGTTDSKLYGYSESVTPSPTPSVTLTPTPTPALTSSPTPTPPPSETIPPSVSITSPLNGSSVKRRSTVTIQATASDNAGVAKVEFYIGTSLISTDTTSPYSASWKVPNSKKSFTITAKAYDTSNNSTSASVTVRSY